MEFNIRLNNLFETRKITAYKLSKDTGIPQAMISRWKKGPQEPSLENAQKLAAYFTVSLDYLLGKTDDPTPADKKNSPLGAMSSKEALKQFLIKEGVLPTDQDITDEEVRTLSAMADAFFSKGKKK